MSEALENSSAHFFDDRWEQDRIRHFFFLDTPAYARVSTLAKHSILKGHRGTGKTTLLKALDWQERTSNPHLQAALGGDPFRDRIVGCFFQIKFLPVNMIDLWLRSSNAETKHTIISTYLRSNWLLEACDALDALNDRLEFSSFASQLEALSSVARSFWDWCATDALGIAPVDDPDVLTLAGIRTVASRMMKMVRSSAAIESPSPESVIALLDLTEFGPLVNSIFDAFSQLLGNHSSSQPWIFRICMDEGEFLSADWALTVRTLMRETDAPLYLTISVLHDLGSETVTSGADISIDDREIVDLDDRPPEQMVHLLSGIIRARLRQHGAENRQFDLRSFLGNPDVDELFELATSLSERRTGRAARRPRKPSTRAGGPVRTATPTYVRDYMRTVGAIANSDPAFDDQDRRRAESIGYRKKKTAGYLHLLGSVGLDQPRYAGWRISVAMCDNSVRDFMRFLRYAMDISENRNGVRSVRSPAAFLAQPGLAYETQDGALKRLGEAKLDSLPQRITSPVQADALIRLFGEFAHQQDFYSSPGLKRPNATKLVLRAPRIASMPAALVKPVAFDVVAGILVQCASYGYVADLEANEDRQEVQFRVNLSFARRFGFSYWKPQYTAVVPWDLVEVVVSQPTASMTTLVRQALGPNTKASARHVDESQSNSESPTLPGLDLPFGGAGS